MPLESELTEGKPWQFDAAVAERFDDMLERSIPDYRNMRELVTLVASARAFSRPGTILDLGCSRGEALAPLVELAGDDPRPRFVGYEMAPPMLEAATERFAGDERVAIVPHDLRGGIPAATYPCNVVLSVLTLMFVPTNYRARLLADVYRSLADGGLFVLVEKVVGGGPVLDDVFNANYHKHKADSGYTPDEIDRKRLSLEGVLVPLSADDNRNLLARAGFREVDEFWSWMNFRAWAAVR